MVYRGVMKGNTVVLDEPVSLPDGTVVEVRAVAESVEDEREREEDARKAGRKVGVGGSGLVRWSLVWPG